MRRLNDKLFRGPRLCLVMLALCTPALSSAQQLFWSQFGSQVGSVSQLGRMNLDGSGSITLVQSNEVAGMETLSATRQVYWIDNGAAAIMRANADFSGVTRLVAGLGGGNHLNLALDPAADLIFWSNSERGTIGRANLRGGPILGTFASAGGYPDDLALDPTNQLLYWSTQRGGVFRSHYDGSGQIELMTFGTSLGSGASGLALDLVAGTMYLSIPNDHRIVRANLDGTGVQTVLATTERPFGMELFNGRMYWADLDDGRLRSANLDGTAPTTILENLSLPRQVSIMPVSDAPQLNVSRSGTAEVRIAWAADFTSYVLEHAASLPATDLAGVTNSVTLTGDYLSATVDIGGGKRFFRLRKP